MAETVVCPWCENEVVLDKDICPECMHEVLPSHLESGDNDQWDGSQHVPGAEEEEAADALTQLESEYFCSNCDHKECRVQEVAMTGPGISKLLDIQHHHYWFASCLNCGVVKIYDPNVLRSRKQGELSSGLDLLLG
ncbi:zinc ribbon domain-containing protein [Paenibacillus chungangensis]|uniref:Zinc ribbon domain-containing protein n=1 Tax=Paenibacillus chungangensis TaxID=696535 RepID=A0ABW3HPC9_9BACL